MNRWALKTILSTRITDLVNGIKRYMIEVMNGYWVFNILFNEESKIVHFMESFIGGSTLHVTFSPQ